MKKIVKEGAKKITTFEIKITEKHEQGICMVDLTRFYNKSLSIICTILKKKEEIMGLGVTKGVMRVIKQWPQILEDVKKLLLIKKNTTQLAYMVTKTISCQKAEKLHDNLVNKMPH